MELLSSPRSHGGSHRSHGGSLTAVEAYTGAMEAHLRAMVFILTPLKLIWSQEGCLGAIEAHL